MIQDGDYSWYQPTLPFFWMNTITTVGAILLLLIGPGTMAIYYLKNFKKWETENFEDSHGALLEGLRKDIKMAIFYPIFFMFRRIVFTA